MPYGTFFESEDTVHTAHSFVVFITADHWASTTNGTLPFSIPASVVEEPLGGSAKLTYRVLKVDTADLGPVSIAGADPAEGSDVVPLRKGDVVIVQVLGLLPGDL